ncbi:RNF31 ligase, partial [Cinclus mexicanus]|nr:RNF31 ligase [Cinclus mexicanus]
DPRGLPQGLESLRTALNILEKYGRNLLSPRPPRHWRGVRFGNPVFKTTVGAIKGGRAVLKLLGYTEESGEGLSFPPPPQGPHPPRVASVTADVLVLRAELDLLLANRHPNPQFFTQILLGQDEVRLVCAPAPPVGGGEGQGWACRSCTFQNPSPTVLCQVCERPRLARRPQPSPAPAQVWPCPRCTFLNRGHAPTCEVCGLGHAPSADVASCTGPSNSGSGDVTSGSGDVTSGSETISNVPTPVPGVASATSCSGQAASGSVTTTSSSGSTTSGSAATTSSSVPSTSGSAIATSCSANTTSGVVTTTSASGPALSRDALRQRKLLEDGRRLVALVRAAESQGLPPESLGPTPFSEIPEFSGPSHDLESQIRHFRSRLGGILKTLLEEACSEKEGGASLGPFSLAEAAWAWLEGMGRFDHALSALIGRRKKQVKKRWIWANWDLLVWIFLLTGFPFSLTGFSFPHTGLYWSILVHLPQALVRQILATLPVASWGRALLVATLGRELGLGVVADPSKESLLGELVEAVGSCPDRAALRRRLRCECAVCGWG